MVLKFPSKLLHWVSLKIVPEKFFCSDISHYNVLKLTENAIVVSLTVLTPTVRVLKKQCYQNFTKFKMFQLHKDKVRVNNTNNVPS